MFGTKIAVCTTILISIVSYFWRAESELQERLQEPEPYRALSDGGEADREDKRKYRSREYVKIIPALPEPKQE